MQTSRTNIPFMISCIKHCSLESLSLALKWQRTSCWLQSCTYSMQGNNNNNTTATLRILSTAYKRIQTWLKVRSYMLPALQNLAVSDLWSRKTQMSILCHMVDTDIKAHWFIDRKKHQGSVTLLLYRSLVKFIVSVFVSNFRKILIYLIIKL